MNMKTFLSRLEAILKNGVTIEVVYQDEMFLIYIDGTLILKAKTLKSTFEGVIKLWN